MNARCVEEQKKERKRDKRGKRVEKTIAGRGASGCELRVDGSAAEQRDGRERGRAVTGALARQCACTSLRCCAAVAQTM